MFKIRKRHIRDEHIETIAECADPIEAYEKAHALDADLADRSYIIEIVTITEGGKEIDMWEYCARRRCPTGAKNEYLNNLEK